MPIDDHLADLRALAEAAAASVAPIDLAAYEEALTAEAARELEAEIARRRAATDATGIDWQRIERLARAVDRQRR